MAICERCYGRRNVTTRMYGFLVNIPCPVCCMTGLAMDCGEVSQDEMVLQASIAGYPEDVFYLEDEDEESVYP